MEAEKKLTELQQAELDILDVVVGICEKHHLRYYLNAGSILGAVRHEGFIPWDDDIDICMPRSDYEAFLACVDEELPDHMRSIYYKKQKKGERLFYSCQIHDLNVPLIQNIASNPIETYAWLDVFPLDGLPNNKLHRKLHGFYLLYRRARMQLSMFEDNVNIYKKNRPWYEKAIIKAYQVTGFGKHSDPHKMMDKLDQALKSASDKNCKRWVCFMGAYKLKEAYDARVFGKGKNYPFEGRMLKGPSYADIYLKVLYGDYMTPRPPASEDDSHKLQIVHKQ